MTYISVSFYVYIPECMLKIDFHFFMQALDNIFIATFDFRRVKCKRFKRDHFIGMLISLANNNDKF